jgi:hypothetical protein
MNADNTNPDPSNPTDTHFLHVLQGADGGAAMRWPGYRAPRRSKIIVS